MNFPDIDWPTNSIIGTQYPRKLNEDYLESINTNNLTQIVDFATRKRTTLDIILTNRPGLIESCEPTPGFGDHDTAVLADIFCHPQKLKPVQRKVYLWNRADTDSLKKSKLISTIFAQQTSLTLT